MRDIYGIWVTAGSWEVLSSFLNLKIDFFPFLKHLLPCHGINLYMCVRSTSMLHTPFALSKSHKNLLKICKNEESFFLLYSNCKSQHPNLILNMIRLCHLCYYAFLLRMLRAHKEKSKCVRNLFIGFLCNIFYIRGNSMRALCFGS